MDLSQVTLAQMRYAVAVDDFRNFRAAARDCHISQSGLSMQIQKLEELLALTLFDRSRKPVLTTPEGERTIQQMRTILRETERLRQVVADGEGPSGRYHLGVIPSLSSSVVPLFLGTFLSRYPRVELIIEELKTEEIITRLQADAIDGGIAATPLDIAGLHEDVLAVEAMFAYLPPGDRLLRRKTVSQVALAERDLWVMPEGHCFRSQVLSYCSTERRPGTRAPEQRGRVRFESGSFQTLVRLVDEGLGATVLPALVADSLSPAHQKTQLRPLVRPTPAREIGLVTARADLRRRVSEVLVEVLKETLGEALGPTRKSLVVLDPLEEPNTVG